MTRLFAAVLFCLCIAASQIAAGEIAFLSNRDAFDQLCVVNADGTGLTRLGLPGRHDRCGVWSPDGTRLAVVMGPRGAATFSLAVVDADGMNPRFVAGAGCDGFPPTWSPDGHRLAFTREGLFTCELSGGDLKTLVRGTTVRGAAWSPDGQWIAYTIEDGRRQRVCVVHSDGTGNRAVTDPGDGHKDSGPRWTADGRLVFASDRQGDQRTYSTDLAGDGLRETGLLTGSSEGRVLSPDGRLAAFTRNPREVDAGSRLLIANSDGTVEREVAAGLMGPAFPSWSPDGRRLLFTSVRGGMSDIHVINDDGTGLRPVTATPVGEGALAWSPDGQCLATSQTNGSPAAWLYVVGADGRNGRRIDTDGHYQVNPFWLPDGKRLLFANLCCPGPGLGLVSLDDRKTSYFAAGAYVTGYAVSPDCKQVAYIAGGGQSPKLYLIALGSTEPKPLYDCLHYKDGVYGFSPDGSRILFTGTVEGNQDVYTIGSDGNGLRRLTEGPAADATPAWSPDGKTIAFVTGAEGKRDLALVSADGGACSPLTRLGLPICSRPEWSADSRKLVFSAGTEGNCHLYVVDVAGGECRQLTDGPGSDDCPRWRPQ